MTVLDRPRVETRAPKSGLGLFITLTFLMTWGIAAMFVFAPDVAGQAGLTNPLYVLAVWSPAFAGIVVAWRRLGISGMRGFFGRLRMIRMPAIAWLVLLVGMPAIVYAGAAFPVRPATHPCSHPATP